MAVNESIVTGRKFRKLIDEATKLWQRISFWTKASDVEFDDGQTAETKMGAIKGITADFNVTEEGYAADAKTTSEAITQLYSEMIGTILWENQNPSEEFSAQTITLSENYKNYKTIEIVTSFGNYWLDSSISMINISSNMAYESFRPTTRAITFDENKVTIEKARVYSSFKEFTENSKFLIPYKIIGYK